MDADDQRKDKLLFKPESKADAARGVATRLWEQFPNMKPVGAARIKRHLAELESLLATVTEGQIWDMVLALKEDKYRRQWVSSVVQIADNLPKIRAVLETGPVAKRESFTERWRKESQT